MATDVGGTFTDLVAYDEVSGDVVIAKSLTTQHDQSEGVLNCIGDAAARSGLEPSSVDFFVHGGTTVINAITERKGVRTALITTSGFRDVLEIGRGNRPDLYNLQSRSPEPYVPRRFRYEVTERLDARGDVVMPLDENDVKIAAEKCREAGIEAIAVVFLHSYVNPMHERRCVELLEAFLPGVSVSASSSVSRQWREYERSNTVALNAYVQPIIERYFASLERSLGESGVVSDYFAMQSNGGVATFKQAAEQPLSLVESGPSGGVSGAVRIGADVGDADILYFDVGGTTAKCSLIRHGRPQLTPSYRLERSRLSPGYPIQVPVVDIVEIGAGGGSIAWLDDTGRLHVGPRSAGSNPGPVCYARGGQAPTVTDAKLVIGILDPDNFAGGQMKLDLRAAQSAFGPIAEALGKSIEAAALAVVRIAEASMIDALKLVTVERGHDPRDLSFVVSGGAGPMLAARLGRELRVKSTIIPVYPGIFSAWGMLAAHPRVDLRRTFFGRVNDDVLSDVAEVFDALVGEAVVHFGVSKRQDLSLHYRLEARYKGQEHSVATAFEPNWTPDRYLQAFHDAHETAFTFKLPEAPVEITNVHLQAELLSRVVNLAPVADEGRSLETALKGTRMVFIDEDTGWVKCDVLNREKISVDEAIDGPLLIEEATTTSLVLPGQTLTVNRSGLLIINEGV
jgi:N-methylhydantoinase A